MKLGLLQCDHTMESVRGIAGDYDEMFARWFPAEWIVYDLQRGERPVDLRECDAYVTTGSKASVYEDEPWIQSFAELVREIRTADLPFLGVCFGHQMLGHALGGRVAKSPNGWGIGVHTFAITAPEPWMDPPAKSVNVLMSCQDQVQELPPGAAVLGGNAHCPIGVFRVGKMLGIQGHPEFTPAYAEALLHLRRERIGAEKVDAALATLGKPLDAQLIRGWVENFIA
ncbi:MAG: amidotransferase [Acidobacteria bacterium]|nr:amidotransferase [Acidobacteriota bacterium]